MSGGGHFLQRLLRKDAVPSVVRSTESGRVLAADLELTLDSESRRRGLLGREGLGEDAALIIAPCNGIHTWFMRFTIDVVFVDKAGRVCLPDDMARAAGIEDEAVLVGLLDRFEIWNPDRYEKVKAADAVLATEAFKMME